MNDETEQQAVIEGTDGQATPAPEGTDAQDQSDELEQLLAQYDEGTSQPEQQQPAQPGQDAASDVSKLAQEVQELRSALTQTTTKTDMADLVKRVKGDTEFGDETLVEAWVDAEARKDPRLQQAWMNRHDSPKQFEKVAAQLGQRFAKLANSMPDKQATDDREAVTAAVRGASKQAPETDDINEAEVAQMNDAEFYAWRRSQATG